MVKSKNSVRVDPGPVGVTHAKVKTSVQTMWVAGVISAWS
jgi:hypothetical protein